jgi:hypothetical protein
MVPKGGPVITMVVVVTASASAVAYSHYAQVRDKAVMKAGVERDRERLRMLRKQRKQERLLQQASEEKKQQPENLNT